MVFFYTVADEPSMTPFNAGGTIALGELITISSAGTFTSGRWHSPEPSQPTANVTYQLWTGTGVPVTLTPSLACDQAVAGVVPPAQFVTFTPVSPIALAAGTYWGVIEILGSGGGSFGYNAIPHFYDTVPVTRGIFTQGPPGFGSVGSNPNTFGTFTSSYTIDMNFTVGVTRVPDFMPFFE